MMDVADVLADKTGPGSQDLAPVAERQHEELDSDEKDIAVV